MILALVAPVQNAPGLHYRNPRVPLNIKLPDNLECGNQIYIHGAVSLDATRFSVNLKDAEVDANTLMHFNPRFGDEHVVVRNSRLDESWGTEEREGDNPFVSGEPFLITITPSVDGYEVEVNGRMFTQFQHREGMPLCNVTHITVKGDIVLYGVHVPLPRMPIPLVLKVPGKTCVGDMFYIEGEVPDGSDRFAVNLQCGSDECCDVMFHLNPRFGDGVVVCNSRCCDAWDQEERESGLPLQTGQQFSMCVAADNKAFHTFVNGSPFMKFKHRLNMASACTLLINGDISVRNVNIDSLPSKLSPQIGDLKIRDFEENSAEVFYPDKPAVLAIPNSFGPGKVVVVTGMVDSDPSRFKVNLQSGAGDDGDIAFHFNPRWDADDGPSLVLNSRIGGEWGEEEGGSNPIAPGARVEIQVACLDDCFSVSVDGDFTMRFPHRMDCTLVDHLVVDGGFTVHRLLAAD